MHYCVPVGLIVKLRCKPDINGREQILKVHLKKIKYNSTVLARIIARGTPGFSGAELANLVNEAALIAARLGKKEVDMHDMEEAKDKVLMGVARRSIAMSEKEKRLTAYHEGGHALVGLIVLQHHLFIRLRLYRVVMLLGWCKDFLKLMNILRIVNRWNHL